MDNIIQKWLDLDCYCKGEETDHIIKEHFPNFQNIDDYMMLNKNDFNWYYFSLLYTYTKQVALLTREEPNNDKLNDLKKNICKIIENKPQYCGGKRHVSEFNEIQIFLDEIFKNDDYNYSLYTTLTFVSKNEKNEIYK